MGRRFHVRLLHIDGALLVIQGPLDRIEQSYRVTSSPNRAALFESLPALPSSSFGWWSFGWPVVCPRGFLVGRHSFGERFQEVFVGSCWSSRLVAGWLPTLLRFAAKPLKEDATSGFPGGRGIFLIFPDLLAFHLAGSSHFA